MKSYVYLIGSTDDFVTLEELTNAYFNNHLEDLNAYFFEFDLPMNCSNEIAVRVGRGLAFENGWCMDDTLSTLLEA